MQEYQNTLAVSTGLADPDKQNKFINSTIPVMALLPHAQSTPNMTVKVEGANSIMIGGKSFAVDSQNSPTFTAPVSGTETHLLYAYNNAGTLTLAIKTSGFTAGEPDTYNVQYPICEVELDDDSTSITDSMITDVRPSNGGITISTYSQNSIYN